MANEILSLNVYYSINLRSFDIRTTTDANVVEFKVMVALHFDVPVDRQRLFHINGELYDDQTIESYGLQDGHVIYLIRGSIPAIFLASTSVVAVATQLGRNDTPDISTIGSIQNQRFGGSSDGTVPGILINVQYSSETRFSIRTRLELMVGELKGLIAQLQNIPVNEQRLIYSGQFLQDDKTIGSYGLQEGHVIHMARRTFPTRTFSSPSVFDSPPAGEDSTYQSAFGYAVEHPYMIVTFLINNEFFPEGSNMLGQRYDNVNEPLLNGPFPRGRNADM